MGQRLSDEEVYGPTPSSSSEGVHLSDEDVYGPAPSSASSSQGEHLSDEDVYGPAAAPAAPGLVDRATNWAARTWPQVKDVASYLVSEDPKAGLLYDVGLPQPTAAAPAPVKPFVGPPEAPQPARTVLGTAGDVVNVGLQGVFSALEASEGLADIPTLGRYGQAMSALGFDMPAARDASNYLLRSDAQQWADERVQAAQGAVPTLRRMVANPSTIAATVAESVPTMVAGGKVGEAVGAIAPKLLPYAGAVGEGSMSAGSTAEQVREATPDGTLSPGQAGIALASGGLTGLLGVGGGKLAHRLGIEDVDNFVAGLGQVSPGERKNVVKRVLQGAVSEGLFEEMPQSAQEQIAQNLALGKPWDEGVAEATVQGVMAGAVTGGAMQLHRAPPSHAEALAQALAADVNSRTPVPLSDEQVARLHAALQGVGDANTQFVRRAQPDPAVAAGAARAPDVAGAGQPAPDLPGAGAQLPGDARGGGLAAALGLSAAPATGPYTQGVDPALSAAGAAAAARAAEPYGGLAAGVGGNGPDAANVPLTQGAQDDSLAAALAGLSGGRDASALAAALTGAATAQPVAGPGAAAEPGTPAPAALGAGQHAAGAPGSHASGQPEALARSLAQGGSATGGGSSGRVAGPGQVDVAGQAQAGAAHDGVDRTVADHPFLNPTQEQRTIDRAHANDILAKPEAELTPADRAFYEAWRAHEGYPLDPAPVQRAKRAVPVDSTWFTMQPHPLDAHSWLEHDQGLHEQQRRLDAARQARAAIQTAQASSEPPKMTGKAPGVQVVGETPAWYKNPLLLDLKRMGLHPGLMTEFAPGPTEQQPLQSGAKKTRLFRDGGLELDDAHQALIELGYLPSSAVDDDSRATYDLVKQAVNGERILPIYSDKGKATMEAEAARASFDEAQRVRAEWEAQASAALPAAVAGVDNPTLQGVSDDVAAQEEPAPPAGAGAAQPVEPVAAREAAAVPAGSPEGPGPAAEPGGGASVGADQHAPAGGAGEPGAGAGTGQRAGGPDEAGAQAPAAAAPDVGAQPEEPGRVARATASAKSLRARRRRASRTTRATGKHSSGTRSCTTWGRCASGKA